MNDLEELIMKEISTLSELRLIDVLGFIRFLKAETPSRQPWIEEWFENSLQAIHARKSEYQITEADIQMQIRSLRERK